MPKCPKCGKEIDFLWKMYSAEITFKYDFHLDEEGKIVCTLEDESEYPLWTEWMCPQCGEFIFGEESEAIAFLKESERDEN